MAQFPKAPINDVKAADPIMKRVDMDNGEIGSRPANMPKDVNSEQMSLRHVGRDGDK